MSSLVKSSQEIGIILSTKAEKKNKKGLDNCVMQDGKEREWMENERYLKCRKVRE